MVDTTQYEESDYEDIIITDDDVADKEEGLVGAKKKGSGVYPLGMGTSVIRALPIWVPSPRDKDGNIIPDPATGKVLKGKWKFSITIQIHKRPLSGDTIVCVEETKGMEEFGPCPVCAFRRGMGKHFGWKSEMMKMLNKHLNLGRPSHQGLYCVQVVADCGDKGDEKWPRKPPEPGMVMPLYAGYGLDKELIARFKDIDFRDALDPKKGSDIKIQRAPDPKTQRPSTSASFVRKPRPIDQGIAFKDGQHKTIPDILGAVPDFHKRWLSKPDADETMKLEALLKQVTLDIMSGVDIFKKKADEKKAKEGGQQQKPVDGGQQTENGTQKALPETIDANAVEVVQPVRHLGIVPTKETGGDGRRICYNKGARDGSNAICAICPDDVTCDEA